MADSPHLAVFTKGGVGSDPHSSFQAGWLHALFLATLFLHTQWGWFWSPFMQGGCTLCSWQLSSHWVGLVLIPPAHFFAGWVHVLLPATLLHTGWGWQHHPQQETIFGGYVKHCCHRVMHATSGSWPYNAIFNKDTNKSSLTSAALVPREDPSWSWAESLTIYFLSILVGRLILRWALSTSQWQLQHC